MGFVALILALAIEQLRPLRRDNFVHLSVVRLATLVRANTEAGRGVHGIWGWALVVGGMLAALVGIEWAAASLHPLAQFALHVFVLYATIGFRQFSSAFTGIQMALAAGDVDGARTALEAWIRESDPDYSAGLASSREICRQAIAHALVQAHRHVFAPLLWYLLLPGAVGPVLYRLAESLARQWVRPPEGVVLHDAALQGEEPYGRFARRAYLVLDWLPLRLSVAGFAIVGNFEDAVYCWRGAVATWRAGATAPVPVAAAALDAPPDARQRVLLLAAGGGALGVRLADPELEADWRRVDVAFDWTGVDPEPSALRSAVGLVWRAVVLWIVLFALVTVANWLG